MGFFFHAGRRAAPESPLFEHASGSPAYHEWLRRSNPQPGEAFVDTGLASAADCRKLHWSPSKAQQTVLSQLMERAVMRDRELFEHGDPAAEAKRINDLAAMALKRAGLDPERFGVSLPGAALEASGAGSADCTTE